MERINISVLILSFIALLYVNGCTTIDEPPTEIDIKAEVLGIVSPDTIQINQPFDVQMSFVLVCGGTFSKVIRADDSNQVALAPIIHVVPQQVCPSIVQLQTVKQTIQFASAGRYDVVVTGRFGDLRKYVVAVPSFPARPDFQLRFEFVNAVGAPKTYETSTFAFLNRDPRDLQSINSDSTGIWETTFSDTLSVVRYIIGSNIFEANRGIKSAGVLLIQ